MDPKPFIELKKLRRVSVDWMPGDLKEFYEAHEGLGLSSTVDSDVRLCKLREVKQITFADLDYVIGPKPSAGWKAFSAIRFAMGCFGDHICYVKSAPSAPAGSVMSFGFDVAGPGGTGDEALVNSLLLSEDFDHWIVRLERDQWIEYGLVPGGIDDLPAARKSELGAHFRRLNPRITWGGAR